MISRLVAIRPIALALALAFLAVDTSMTVAAIHLERSVAGGPFIDISADSNVMITSVGGRSSVTVVDAIAATYRVYVDDVSGGESIGTIDLIGEAFDTEMVLLIAPPPQAILDPIFPFQAPGCHDLGGVSVPLGRLTLQARVNGDVDGIIGGNLFSSARLRIVRLDVDGDITGTVIHDSDFPLAAVRPAWERISRDECRAGILQGGRP